MIYSKSPIALLTLLAAEEASSTNAQIARYLLAHGGDVEALSVKSLASACHVGTGTVSRFARDAGFESFAELREELAAAGECFERVGGDDAEERAASLARTITDTISQAAAGVDRAALTRLVADLHAYDEVGVYGLLKAQSAALDLQVDLLMLGKLADTCVPLADQTRRIVEAGRNKLVIVFSYTGSYFDGVDVTEILSRIDRPKIWVVCGEAGPLPSFVSDRLIFSSDHLQFGHPYQLEYVAGLIAQEFAATL